MRPDGGPQVERRQFTTAGQNCEVNAAKHTAGSEHHHDRGLKETPIDHILQARLVLNSTGSDLVAPGGRIQLRH